MGSGEDVEEARRAIRKVGFHPEVFKKTKNQKAEGADITITRDLLMHGFRDNYDVAVLITGDGDYVPVVCEIKRMGEMVYVAFFKDARHGMRPGALGRKRQVLRA